MAALKNKDFSVLIPVFNEAENVEKLFREIILALAALPYSYEIIFIDDGSTDNTVAHLRQLCEENELLRLVQHAKNAGQSAAILSGAHAARYPFLITLDGDGQNDPKDIPKLLTLLTSNNTVVLGLRQKRLDSKLRIVSSFIANKIRQRLLRDDCPDTGCSLKLFSKEVFLSLPHFNHLHRYLPALFQRAKQDIIYTSVNHRFRWEGQSKYGLWNRLFVGIYDLIGVRWLLKRPCSAEIRSDFNH